jgi:hypothetical protein
VGRSADILVRVRLRAGARADKNVRAPAERMSRHGQLMAAIADPENLRQVFLRAARGLGVRRLPVYSVPGRE